MVEKEIGLLITVTSITFIILSAGIVFFIFYFFKTKQKFIAEKQQLQIKYLNEIATSQVEIHNQTLNHVGRELHDNIGQLLTVAKIYSLQNIKKHQDSEKVNQLDELLNKIVYEVKNLSKSLDKSNKTGFDFLEELKIEIKRLDKINNVSINFNIEGDKIVFKKETEIIMFRIIQEFLNNTFKYSKSEKIDVKIIYQSNKISIQLKDYGIGFDIGDNHQGAGIINIQNRLKVLECDEYHYLSEKNKGTVLNFTIKNN